LGIYAYKQYTYARILVIGPFLGSSIS